MGFFDRFRKNNKETEKEQTPLVLNYTDGTTVHVNFRGSTTIDCGDFQKTVHQVDAVVFSAEGGFTQRKYLLEPIPYTNEKGKVVDGTELYYKQLGNEPLPGEDRSQYNAVKGFFKTPHLDILESNYIGNLARSENGQYIRHYDNEFKRKYDVMYKEQQDEQKRQAEAKHRANEAAIEAYKQEEMRQGLLEKLKNQTIPSNEQPPRGQVEVLTPQRRDEIENGRF